MKMIYGRRIFKNRQKKFLAWLVFIFTSVYTILALNTVQFTNKIDTRLDTNFGSDVLRALEGDSLATSSGNNSNQTEVKSSKNVSSIKKNSKLTKKTKKNTWYSKKLAKIKTILIETRFGPLPFSAIGDLPLLDKDEIEKIKENFILDEFVEKSQNILTVHDGVKLYYNKTKRKLEKLMAKPVCPNESPKLRGTFNRTVDDYKPPSLKETAVANPGIIPGGRFVPPCVPKNKVAIIIPLRGRDHQLRVLLAHLHPVLQRQQIDYTIYTISQEDNGQLFNKAKLMNSGFLEASKYDNYDCFVFHDVDMLVENDECLYTCPETKNPRLLTAHVDKFDYVYNTYYPHCRPSSFPSDGNVHYVGGVTMMTSKQMYDVNGFSGLYWGWGGEDDDMFYRTWKKGYTYENPFEEKCSFHMIKHETETENKENYARFSLLTNSILRMKYEGLSTLRYEVMSVKKEPLYTNITMKVGQPIKKLMNFMIETPEDWFSRCFRPMPWAYEELTDV